MEAISKNTLQKIKKGNIKPIPKWQFLLKDSLVWGLFALNLVLGSIGFAISLYILGNNDVILDSSLVTNAWEWIILSIPIAWILLTILFVFIAYYNFKHTQEGYRFTVATIFLMNIVISIVLGVIINGSGLSQKLNTVFSKHIPFYNHTMDLRAEVWMRPESGYLAGNIVEIDSSSKVLKLEDLNGKEWTISYTDAIVKGRVSLQVGEEIKLVGTMLLENTFNASEVRPWTGSGVGNGMGMQENF